MIELRILGRQCKRGTGQAGFGVEDFYRSICKPQAICCLERCRFLARLGGRETPQLVGRDKTRGVLACSRSAHLRKVGRDQVVLSRKR